MQRLTQKTKDGYTAEDQIQAIQRLGRLEDMYESISEEYHRTAEKMEKLAAENKGKTATYRQLFAAKLTLKDLLTRLDLYLSV